jgi:hypothetical protein
MFFTTLKNVILFCPSSSFFYSSSSLGEDSTGGINLLSNVLSSCLVSILEIEMFLGSLTLLGDDSLFSAVFDLLKVLGFFGTNSC